VRFRHEIGAALSQCTLKQTLGQGRSHERADRAGACRLSRHGYAVRIPTECRDVRANPFQGGDLIEQAKIAGLAGLRAQFGMRKKTENSQPMIDGHNDRAAASETLAVVARLASGTCPELPAMNPKKDRQLCVFRTLRRPHIQIETIFALVRIIRFEFSVWRVLQASRRNSSGIANAGPLRRGTGRTPTQLLDRWWRIGNAEKLADAAHWIPATS
jgi:hypothetical protein